MNALGPGLFELGREPKVVPQGEEFVEVNPASDVFCGAFEKDVLVNGDAVGAIRQVVGHLGP